MERKPGEGRMVLTVEDANGRAVSVSCGLSPEEMRQDAPDFTRNFAHPAVTAILDALRNPPKPK